jgi:glutaredoxin 3
MSIKIYSTPTCHFCLLAKDFFKQNNLSYEEIDLSAEPSKVEEIISKTGQMGVPVIIITKDDGQEEIIIGFNPNKLKEILNIN